MMEGTGLASQGTETAKVKVGRWEGCEFRERGPVWSGRGVRVRGGEDDGILLSQVAEGPGFRLCCKR